MQNQKKIRSKFRFNDAWALLAFSFLTLLHNGFIVSKVNSLELPKTKELLMIAIYLVGAIIAYLVFNICISFIPAFIMHVSVWLLPVFLLYCWYITQSNFLIIFIIFLSILLLFDYFRSIKYNIKYASLIIKDISGLIYSYIPIYIFLSLAITSLSIIHSFWIIKCLIIMTNNSVNSKLLLILDVFFIFLQFWQVISYYYFMRIFAAALVSRKLYKNGNEFYMLIYAFKRGLLSLGTIFFASLLVSILETINFFINITGVNRNFNRKKLFSSILGCISIFFLNFFGILLKFYNIYSTIYSGIYGTGYIRSIKESAEKIKDSLSFTSINNTCLFPTIYLFTISYTICIYKTRFSFIKVENASVEMSNLHLALFMLHFVDFLYVLLIFLDSSLITTSFIYSQNKKLIKDRLPKTYETLEIQLTELQNKH